MKQNCWGYYSKFETNSMAQADVSTCVCTIPKTISLYLRPNEQGTAEELQTVAHRIVGPHNPHFEFCYSYSTGIRFVWIYGSELSIRVILVLGWVSLSQISLSQFLYYNNIIRQKQPHPSNNFPLLLFFPFLFWLILLGNINVFSFSYVGMVGLKWKTVKHIFDYNN